MAPDRYNWAQVWTEGHSRSYGLREDQVQLYMDKWYPNFAPAGTENLVKRASWA